jgi:signal transduction histidine kinase
MRLLIVDDGCGFDPGSKSGAGTLGLIGMRERVLLVSGEIQVESKIGAGTRIVVRVPLPEEAST